MSESMHLLAIDLGAESGRAILGHLDGGMIRMEEVHRFPNGPVRVGNSLHWDVLRLWGEVKASLQLAVQHCDHPLAGMGLDTWGVDFGLLAADDTLLGNPYHYRDTRTDGMMEWAFERVPRNEIYNTTGIQFMQLNSLYQLLSLVRANSPALQVAQQFLTIPDLLNFWLTGRKVNEFTNATTTQCYDPQKGTWALPMLEQLGIPIHIFGEIIQPGTLLGELRNSIADECGTGQIPVIAPATHDTGSAVAAVPAAGEDYLYLSSGTWSLMGVEERQPVISDQTLSLNLTNEGGVNHTIRLLKNIMGLWLVQECRRGWANAGDQYSYDDLTALAAEASAFQAFVDPGNAIFLPIGDMPDRIKNFCHDTGQTVPQSRGEILRCAFESLALEYRRVAKSIENLLDRKLPTIHIIGGGSRNRLLNQFTADATNCDVLAGPVEATAIGNLLVQAHAMGYISSLAEGRTMVRRSYPVEHFSPQASEAWDAAYERYLKLLT
jgi:rhamnulokinase